MFKALRGRCLQVTNYLHCGRWFELTEYGSDGWELRIGRYNRISRCYFDEQFSTTSWSRVRFDKPGKGEAAPGFMIEMSHYPYDSSSIPKQRHASEV